MRGRGLKQFDYPVSKKLHQFAPHAGAWIETIEAAERIGMKVSSPLMRGRGLKLNNGVFSFGRSLFAPHAGAWIETRM